MEHLTAHFRETGTGVSVVCLHSSGSSSSQWRLLMDQLGGRYHVLAADLYSYGRSPLWPGVARFCLADEVSLLENVFQAAGEPFHLIGHSYGGAVALKAALTFPTRVRSLVLFEPTLFKLLMAEDAQQPAAREIADVRSETTAAVLRGEMERAAEHFIDYWMGAGMWAQTPEPRRTAAARAAPKITAEFQAVFEDPVLLSEFSALEVPTLLMVGTESPAASRGVVRLLAHALPQAKTLELGGLGHMGPVSHVDTINAAIEDHLRSYV